MDGGNIDRHFTVHLHNWPKKINKQIPWLLQRRGQVTRTNDWLTIIAAQTQLPV